jgi:hypothetical protein
MEDIITKAYFSGSIFITPHAIDKAMELFDIKDRNEARLFIINNLKRSTYVSTIVGETGKRDRLFAYRRIAFVLDLVEDVVITIYIRDNVDKELRSEVREIICEYLRRMHEQEKELEEKLLALEIEYNMLRELSDRGLFDNLAAEIRLTERCITRTQNELDEFRLKKSKVAKGAVAFL